MAAEPWARSDTPTLSSRPGVDPRRYALLVVDENLEDAGVDEDAEAQGLVVREHDRRCFRRS